MSEGWMCCGDASEDVGASKRWQGCRAIAASAGRVRGMEWRGRWNLVLHRQHAIGVLTELMQSQHLPRHRNAAKSRVRPSVSLVATAAQEPAAAGTTARPSFPAFGTLHWLATLTVIPLAIAAPLSGLPSSLSSTALAACVLLCPCAQRSSHAQPAPSESLPSYTATSQHRRPRWGILSW